MTGGVRTQRACLEAATAAIRATPMGETFQAWRFSPDNPRCEGDPIDMTGVRSLSAAQIAVTAHVFHKDKVAILVTDEVTQRRVVHFYAVKRKSPAPRRWDAENLRYVAAPAEYLDPLFSMAASRFAPVEPWRWSPGCDVVGIDRNTIEGDA